MMPLFGGGSVTGSQYGQYTLGNAAAVANWVEIKRGWHMVTQNNWSSDLGAMQCTEHKCKSCRSSVEIENWANIWSKQCFGLMQDEKTFSDQGQLTAQVQNTDWRCMDEEPCFTIFTRIGDWKSPVCTENRTHSDEWKEDASANIVTIMCVEMHTKCIPPRNIDKSRRDISSCSRGSWNKLG